MFKNLTKPEKEFMKLVLHFLFFFHLVWFRLFFLHWNTTKISLNQLIVLLLTSWTLAAIWFWRMSQEKMNQKRKSLMGQQVFFFFNVDICQSIDDFVNRVETMVLTNVLLCCQVVCLIPKVGSTADSNMVRPKRRNGHQKWDGSMITSMITSDMSPNHKFTFSRLLYISQTKNDLHTRCSHLLFVLF